MLFLERSALPLPKGRKNKTEKKIMKRSHILEERRKQVNPDIRKSVTEVFDRIDAASDAND